MLRVGLSGGIGSGKSMVAQRFSDLGAVVVDADELARAVVEPGSDGLAAIVERFGDTVVGDDGALNRPALGAIVFADEQARRDLERITHPRIAARTRELLVTAPDDAVVVHDVPLLVEKQLGAGYHLVVIVGATERTRLRRLTQKRGMTEDDVRGRMAAQADDEQRRASADVWLDNDGSRDELLEQVDLLWRERLIPFRDNLAAGRASQRTETLHLSPPDPTWPQQARRLAERVALAGGSAVVAVEHIGSTAVPGLLAKDVIDLQVGVRSLADADTEAFLRGLHAAGFPRAAGEWWDEPHDGGPVLPKRLHGNADPGRVAHLHVREVDGPAWRWALLFRDWMRAREAEREEYAALKRRIAATGASATQYAALKEPWFAEGGVGRMEEWAGHTGWDTGPGER